MLAMMLLMMPAKMFCVTWRDRYVRMDILNRDAHCLFLSTVA